jgi:hypothetical protein
MRPIHDHEIHHADRRHVDSRTTAPSPVPLLRLLLDVVPLPLLFVGLVVAWPVMAGVPAPWWAWAGAALYGGMAGVGLLAWLWGKG